MSSGSPGRYQSRLFNFLNRQSRRLTDQYDRTVRHLKVAAVWGTQILLYPVYLVVQAALSAGRQISCAAQAGWSPLKAFTSSQPPEPPPAADTPIQQVLSEVNTLKLNLGRLTQELKVESSEDNPQPATFSNLQPATASNLQPVTPTDLSKTTQESSEEHWMIQGVASLLATHTLVLVTVQNQILDILTPQQQKKLASKISWEMANLRRQWRIAQASEHQFTQRLSGLDQPRVFPPVRLFWNLMAWIQTSPVAIAANLFQESSLVRCGELKVEGSNLQPLNLHPSNLQTFNLQPSNFQPSTPVKGALAFLDRTVAELESHQLVPGSEVVIVLRDSFASRIEKLLQQVRSQSITSGDTASSPEASRTNTFRIQALIYAAIDYFFGRRRSDLPDTGSQEQTTILANQQGEAHQLSGGYSTARLRVAQTSNLELADASESDPWLTSSDLFGNSDALESAQNPKSPAQLPESFNSKTPVKPGNSVLGVVKRYLSFKQPPGKLSAPTTGKLTVEPPKFVLQTPTHRTDKVALPRQTQDRQKITAPRKRKTQPPNAVVARSTSISPAKAETTALTTSSSPSPNSHLEPAPDWIETPATPNGYVKHPLERLLEGVDLVMLWLEELVLKLWRWLQQLWRRG
jgi:hypothetical protein